MSEFHCCGLAAESGFWHTKECPYGAVMAERDSLKAQLEVATRQVGGLLAAAEDVMAMRAQLEEQERIAAGLAAALRGVQEQAALYRPYGDKEGAAHWRTALDLIEVQAREALRAWEARADG